MNAAFGRRVGGLADLAFEGCDRRSAHDNAALTILSRFVFVHDRGGFLGHVEGADEIDLDNPVEIRGRPRSFATERTAGVRDAGAVHSQRDTAHVHFRLLHRCLNRLFIRDIGIDVRRALAQLSSALVAEFIVYIEQDDLTTRIDDALCCCKTKTRRTARNDSFSF